MKCNRPVLAAVASVMTFAPIAPAADWIATTGNWGDAFNWSGNAVPVSTSDTAFINNTTAAITLNNNYSIGATTFNGGSIGGAYSLTLASLNWGRGIMRDAGTTTVTGNATLSPLTLNTDLTVTNGRTLVLQGSTTLGPSTSAYGLYLTNNATLSNTGAFTLADNAQIYGGGSAFNNGGLLIKAGGPGTANVNFLTNTGTVSVIAGTLNASMAYNGTSTGGFSVTSGSTLNLSVDNGTHTLITGATLTGPGTIRFTGGAFDLQGGRTISGPVNIISGSVKVGGTTTFSGGLSIVPGVTVSGTGSLTASTLNWTGGTFTGAADVTVLGNATLSPATQTTDLTVTAGRSLTLQGNTTLGPSTAAYGLYLTNGATLTNNGTLALADSSQIYGGGSTFNNTGTINTATGGGKTSVNFLTNTGTVNVPNGTLNASLFNGNTSTGKFDVAEGATLNLAVDINGTHTLAPAVTLAGSGSVNFVGGTFEINGTHTINGPVSLTNVITNFNGATTLAGGLKLNNATFGGSGTVTASTFDWTRGTINGTGTTVVTGNATITPATLLTDLFLTGGRTLTLQGNTTLGSSASNYGLYLTSANATLNNAGIFTLADTAQVYGFGGTFNNSGTLTKPAGSGVAAVNFLTNTGTTSVAAGTLNASLKADGTSTGGFTAGSGATLGLTVDIGGTHTLTPAATLSGAGTVRFNGGTIVLQGNRTLTTPVVVAGGTVKIGGSSDTFASLTFSGGRLDVGTGVVTLNGGGAANATATRLLVAAGRDFASGYFSSSADATHRLGYADTGTGIKVRYTLAGDADLDGGVSINDFNALAGNFGSATGRVWTDGDFDYDGGVSINDFNLLAAGFGQTLTADSDLWAGLLAFAAAHDDLAAFEAVTGVPEPTGVGLLAAGVTLGLRRRRR